MGLRIVRVTRMLLEDAIIHKQDVPKDAMLINVIRPPSAARSDCYELVCQSKEWPSVPEGQDIPWIDE